MSPPIQVTRSELAFSVIGCSIGFVICEWLESLAFGRPANWSAVWHSSWGMATLAFILWLTSEQVPE